MYFYVSSSYLLSVMIIIYLKLLVLRISIFMSIQHQGAAGCKLALKAHIIEDLSCPEWSSQIWKVFYMEHLVIARLEGIIKII